MYLALVLSLFGVISFFPLTGCRFLFEDLYYSESNDSEDGVCTVTGTVTFDDGTPAGGAIVSVYYTQNLETSTDTSGTFSVEVTWPYYKDPPYEGVISAYYSEAEQVSQALTLQKNKTISVDITIPRVGVIESGIVQEGYIQESGETDWYKFSALAGEMVEVTLQQHVSPVDPEVALYQSGSTTALWSESDRDGQDAPTELNSGNLLIEADGDYYVRVKDYGDNDTSAVTPYLLTVSVMNNPDLAEPVNNERDGAIELTSGSPRQGHIATVNDVDWYKIDAYAGQAVRVEASLPQNNELGLKVEIYEQYSTSRFWYDYDSNAETAPISFDSGQQLISTDGTYYIRVVGYGHTMTVPYTLKVTVN